jgi:uncharacterized protein YaaQ
MTVERPDPTKLVVMVVSDSDANKLMKQIVKAGFSATKIGSTGGFLRRGSVTILSGVADEQLDALIDIVRETSHDRKEFVPVQTLPFLGDGGFTSEPVEVRVGGAIVFVLDIERFERV